ncbi:uncharacterized protein METZ01_LOCUS464166 [marine metagenome]|uniref:Uncharacterized protein n=1 Tax=marine metagenome TaxID=408172 RepID=A0A383AUC2_9ZZZZ
MDLRQIGRSVGKRSPFKLSKFYPAPDLCSSTNSVPIHASLAYHRARENVTESAMRAPRTDKS